MAAVFACCFFARAETDADLPADFAAPAPREMECFIVPTRQHSKLDFIHKVPKGKIMFNSTRRAYRNEEISVVPFILNAADAEGNYKIRLSLKIVSPSGASEYLEKPRVASGRLGAGQRVVWPVGALAIVFEDSDAPGKYKFVFEAENLLTGARASKEAAVELCGWSADGISPIAGNKEFMDALRAYHSHCSPSVLYALYISGNARIFQNGKLNELLYIFFREAFRPKPFLCDFVAEKFDTATDAERKNTMILLLSLGEIGKIAGKPMTAEEKTFLGGLFKLMYATVSPYEKNAGWFSHDVLWGEFYANGNYRPIERSLSLLGNIGDAENFVAFLKSGGSPDAWDAGRARADLLLIASAYSLLRNANVKLMTGYADYFMELNKDKYSAQDLKRAFSLVRDYLSLRADRRKSKESAANITQPEK